MTSAAARDDDELWFAVGDPSRQRVLDLLVARGSASSTALAAELPFTRQAVAKHLAVLERAGLVSGARRGREVLYVVEADRLDEATRVLARVAARWDGRLAAIKRLAEEAHRGEGGDA
ncbi:MAG TPA: metalloregulator ArsR/SmtB family transcription factor [Baekduia sp.]